MGKSNKIKGKENIMENTNISWTDHTFNPWMGCKKISSGCKNCYAEKLVQNRMGYKLWDNNERKITSDTNWKKPLKWNKEAKEQGVRYKVFSGSLCDIFEERDDLVVARKRLWELIKNTPELDWQLLTKRPENIEKLLPDDWGDGYSNVWLGTTVENEKVIERANILRGIPAQIRFISYEPALGDLSKLNIDKIDWIIYGGESGSGFRDHDINWAREMKNKCAKENVAFYYKQSPAFKTGQCDNIDGEIIKQFPIRK